MKFDSDTTINSTSAGTATIGHGTTSTATLRLSTPKSRSETELLKRQIITLESEIRRQQKNIEDLLNRIEEHEVVNFTKEELMFILSRVHPDKNPDSKLAHQLTQKLIRKRNG